MNTQNNTLLNALPRVTNPAGGFSAPSLFLPDGTAIEFTATGQVKTTGLGNLDAKAKDLLEVIEIENALLEKYRRTGLFSPRTYLESLPSIPCHATVQGVLLVRMTGDLAALLSRWKNEYSYGKTNYDRLWLEDVDPCNVPEGTVLLVANRRIGGWDGSVERPVIELLGGGGHIPAIARNGVIESMSPDEVLQNELTEELGMSVEADQFSTLGGFFNSVSSELVMLRGLFLQAAQLENIQAAAFGNVEENTDGIYIGVFNDMMDRYMVDASPFAGGEKAKATNFPSQAELMDRIRSLFAN